MITRDVLARLEPIFRDLFDEYTGPVHEALTANDVEQWDSLSHVQLIVMIEKAFGIRFTTSDITDLKNLGALADVVIAKAA